MPLMTRSQELHTVPLATWCLSGASHRVQPTLKREGSTALPLEGRDVKEWEDVF